MPDKTYYRRKPIIKEEPYAKANDSTQDAEQPVKGMHLQRDKNEISKDKAPENPEHRPVTPPPESRLLFAFAHSSFSVNLSYSNLPGVQDAVKL